MAKKDKGAVAIETPDVQPQPNPLTPEQQAEVNRIIQENNHMKMEALDLYRMNKALEDRNQFLERQVEHFQKEAGVNPDTL